MNGLRNYKKASDIFNRFLYGCQNPDIVFFQETHCTSDLEKDLLVASNYDMCFANKDADSGGLITAFNRNLDYNVSSFEAFQAERSQMLLINCTILEKPYVLVNVYLHPKDGVGPVLSSFAKTLQKIPEVDVIMGGDFNALLNGAQDTSNPSPLVGSHACRTNPFASFVNSLNAQDLGKIFSPHHTKYTHFLKGGQGSFAYRIDYIFTNEGLLNFVLDVQVGLAFKTDHCPIS